MECLTPHKHLLLSEGKGIPSLLLTGQTHDVCRQGGRKIKKLHLGFQFFFSRLLLNQPANVIRHMSILGNMMSLLCYFPSMPFRQHPMSVSVCTPGVEDFAALFLSTGLSK